jgi:hypothetical protein
MSTSVWRSIAGVASWRPQFAFGDAVKPPPAHGAPAGFEATFSHDNIAVQAATGKLWLRDARGHEAVLDPEDILGWQVRNDDKRKNMRASGPEQVFLDIASLGQDKNLWSIRFSRHDGTAFEGRNLEECREWSQRLTALYNPGEGCGTRPLAPPRP